MAKTGPKLSNRIQILFDAVELGNIPPKRELMDTLMQMLPLSEGLESGEALAESEKQVAALEARINELEMVNKRQREELETQNAEFEATLEKATAEIERRRKEEKERNEKPKRLLPVQEQLLQCVRIGGIWKTTEDIAEEVGIRFDLAESHLHILRDKDLVLRVDESVGDELDIVWARSTPGNEYLAEYDLLK